MPNNRARSLFTSVVSTDIQNADISVCLASWPAHNNLPTFQRMQISDDLANDFRNVVTELFGDHNKRLSAHDTVFRCYTPSSKPDNHEIEHLILADHATIEEQLCGLASLVDVAQFQNDSAFLANIRFYVITVQLDGRRPIHCFRVYTPKKELSRSRKFAGIFRGGQFDRITETTLLFDQYVDCLCFDGTMFVFSTGNFQKIFRFFELLRGRAREVLQVMRQHIPITNFSEFESACGGHIQILAKIRNIATKGYLGRLTIETLKTVIARHNLPVRTEVVDGVEKIVFESATKWAILRLLDDDYLDSPMTGQSYEVTGKRELQS